MSGHTDAHLNESSGVPTPAECTHLFGNVNGPDNEWVRKCLWCGAPEPDPSGNAKPAAPAAPPGLVHNTPDRNLPCLSPGVHLALLRNRCATKQTPGHFNPEPRPDMRDWGTCVTDIGIANSALREAMPDGDLVRAQAAVELLDSALCELRMATHYAVRWK